MVANRRVSPPKSELSKLRTPLTAGEKQVFEFLDECLSPDWEIYVQPHLNGCRPDFVLLNPNVGIAVIEVKDWDPDAVQYRNPVEQAHNYKNEIYELYCPRLAHKSGYAAISAGVIFPYAAQAELNRLFPPQSARKYEYVVGKEVLASRNLDPLYLSKKFTQSRLMSEELADDLRSWLCEPDHAGEQREPLSLDANQKSLAATRTPGGYRRIRGPAGSGKSLVLAARAARLANEGKKVLVVTFNITLLHYLRDLCSRAREGHPNQITWLNFHAWCKRVASQAGLEAEYAREWQNHFEYDVDAFVEIPRMLTRNKDRFEEGLVDTYDAILVDEGQDFHPIWWQALRQALSKGGEIVLVADATQDVYETARQWTDEAMIGAGFSGPWSELPTSYRLPGPLLELAKTFAEAFLPEGTRQSPQHPPAQGELELHACELKWIQVEPENLDRICIEELLRLIVSDEANSRAMTDLTLLVDSIEVGERLDRQLNLRGIKTAATFSTEVDRQDNKRRGKDDRRKKMSFWKGRERVKVSSLHSFKGWESRLQVVVITKAKSPKDFALIYTGLTRLKKHRDGSSLTVVCSETGLGPFGELWPTSDRLS
jgi:hypothetical protein